MITVYKTSKPKRETGVRGKRRSIEQIRVLIAGWVRRRAALKEQCKNRVLLTRKNRRKYHARLKVINTALCALRTSLRRHHGRYLLIDRFNKVFKEYSGQEVNFWMGKKRSMEKSIICKHLIDAGVTGRDICDYLGVKYSKAPAIQRTRLTRSFKTRPDKLAAWQKFKNYLIANKLAT